MRTSLFGIPRPKGGGYYVADDTSVKPLRISYTAFLLHNYVFVLSADQNEVEQSRSIRSAIERFASERGLNLVEKESGSRHVRLLASPEDSTTAPSSGDQLTVLPRRGSANFLEIGPSRRRHARWRSAR